MEVSDLSVNAVHLKSLHSDTNMDIFSECTVALFWGKRVVGDIKLNFEVTESNSRPLPDRDDGLTPGHLESSPDSSFSYGSYSLVLVTSLRRWLFLTKHSVVILTLKLMVSR